MIKKMMFQPKNINFFAVLLFAFFSIAGCSKKNNTSTTSGTSLTGKWITDSAFVYVYDSINGLQKDPIYDTSLFYNYQFAQFNANNIFYAQVIDLVTYDITGSICFIYDTLPYTLYHDSILIVNNKDTSIISFTANNRFIMHSYNIQPYTNGYLEYYFFK